VQFLSTRSGAGAGHSGPPGEGETSAPGSAPYSARPPKPSPAPGQEAAPDEDVPF
jgi:hypothetical protein